jgi:hypothetical protein
VRRAHLIEQARFLRQHAVEVIETVKNPQGPHPNADLNRGHAMLHRAECAGTDSQALREYGHGVVTPETRSLEAVPEV